VTKLEDIPLLNPDISISNKKVKRAFTYQVDTRLEHLSAIKEMWHSLNSLKEA